VKALKECERLIAIEPPWGIVSRWAERPLGNAVSRGAQLKWRASTHQLLVQTFLKSITFMERAVRRRLLPPGRRVSKPERRGHEGGLPSMAPGCRSGNDQNALAKFVDDGSHLLDDVVHVRQIGGVEGDQPKLWLLAFAVGVAVQLQPVTSRLARAHHRQADRRI
jgi:hypothetical protein